MSQGEAPARGKAIALEWTALVVALVLAALGLAVGAQPSFTLFLLAYLTSWALLEALLRTSWRAVVREARPLWLVLVALVPLATLAQRAHTVLANEGLHHPEVRLGDRERLAAPMALDPPRFRTDRPQSFVVHAPDASAVSLALGDRHFAGEPLGADVFRIDVDPRDLTLTAGSTEVALDVDGTVHRQRLEVVVPLAHPSTLVLGPEGRACAVSTETDELLRIDARSPIERIPVADRPIACGFSGSEVVVAHADGALIRWRAGVEPVPWERAEHALSALASAPELTVAVGRMATDGEGLASQLTMWPGGRTLRLEGIADRVVLAGEVLGSPELAVVALRAPARLLVVSLASMTVIAERALSMPAIALAAQQLRVVIAVTDFAEAPHLGNHFVDDQLVELRLPDLEVQAIVHTAGRTPAQDHAGDVDVGAGPRGLAFDPSGAIVVAFEGSREVARYPRLDAPPERWALPRDRSSGEHAPESAVRLGDGTLVAVSPASGAVLRRSGERAVIDALAPSAAALLASDPEALRARMGELAFGEATRSGISCASCHAFGGSDYAAHNIGGRLLAPTLDVRGVAGTAPYLRDGSYPRLRDLHEVSLTEYRGYRLPAGDRAATIAGYLERTTRPPTFVVTEVAAARRGAEVFVRAGCPSCHAPPAFTDLGQHAGSAVFPAHDFATSVVTLDTPSLRGVAESPPYLYDGRAPSLRDVMTAENQGDRHGHTAGLSDADIDALVAFLRALP